jgi:hypothetical protein
MCSAAAKQHVTLSPTELLELYCNAINAYLRGEPPSVGEHEWAGAIAGYIPKKLSALLMSDFRPIGCICTKYSLLLFIVDQRLNDVTEDYGLVNDKQEGFRRHTSTNASSKNYTASLRSSADERTAYQFPIP